MQNILDVRNLEVLFVEHFNYEDDAKEFIDEMLDDGLVCNLFTSPLGYFVCVLEIALSE